jgi:transcriptional regulator GlxA family with amidase domain
VELSLEFLLQQGDTDVDSLAALIGMSRRSLQRHLRRQGESYARLLDRVRLKRARRLLATSSTKVIDVAFEVGYSDPSHFARAFRRWAGVAPSTYRRVGSPGAISS